MTSRNTWLRRAVGIGTLLVATAGCTIGSPTAAPSPTTTVGTTAPTPSASPSRTPTATIDPKAVPVAGECRYVPDGGFQRFTDLSRITSCDEEHSAETFWVGDVTGAEANEAVPDYLLVVADAQCHRRLTEHFGSGDWLVTRLFPTAFVAPLDQWTLGARWVRCDIYLPEHGPDGFRNGAALHTPVTLDAATIAAFAYCSTYDPDEPELGVTVDCAEPHNYEAIPPTLDLADLGDEFPGDAALESAAGEHCFTAAETYVGGTPDALLISWVQPDQDAWERGERILSCGLEFDGGRVAGSTRGAGDEITLLPFAEGEDDPAIDPYEESADG